MTEDRPSFEKLMYEEQLRRSKNLIKKLQEANIIGAARPISFFDTGERHGHFPACEVQLNIPWDKRNEILSSWNLKLNNADIESSKLEAELDIVGRGQTRSVTGIIIADRSSPISID